VQKRRRLQIGSVHEQDVDDDEEEAFDATTGRRAGNARPPTSKQAAPSTKFKVSREPTRTRFR
jgi:hypothetical protein